MILNIVTEQRFQGTPDGQCWDDTASGYGFWSRYLMAFERVRIIARVKTIASRPMTARRVDGAGIMVQPLRHYIGASQFAARARHNFAVVNRTVMNGDALILRLPSLTALMLAPKIATRHMPYGIELVGDPFDVFSKGAVEHPFRPAFKLFFMSTLKMLCRCAAGIAYVNGTILPKRYPAGKAGYVTQYSSIDLDDSCYRWSPPSNADRNRPHRVLFIGSLEQQYKGADILIDAVARCRRHGMRIAVTIVGDGRYRKQIEVQARSSGLAGTTVLKGKIPGGEAVWRELDACDLFILPARSEGLPRVVIEAMARSKPCISTTVGGIPELLPAQDLVPPNNPEALALKIMEVLSDPSRMHAMGIRNYQHARAFRKEILDARRRAFYVYLRSITRHWAENNGSR